MIRGFGIVLVIAGHLLEKLCLNGAVIYCVPFRIIYFFHMPLFVFMAGMFYRPGVIRWKLLRYYLLFALSSIPFWILDLQNGEFIANGLIATVVGNPVLNWVSWYLLMLLGIEIIIKIVGEDMKNYILIIAVVIGGWLASNDKIFVPYFIGQASVMLPYFIMGYMFRNKITNIKYRLRNSKGLLIAATIYMIIMGFVYKEPIVIAISKYENPVIFYSLGVIGIIGILHVLYGISGLRNLLKHIGINSIYYMFWAGIQFHIVDYYLLKLVE